MESSNTTCNRCMAGEWVTYCVRETRDFHIRYLKCSRCGRTAKQTLPHAEVHRRSPRVQLGNAPTSGDSGQVSQIAESHVSSLLGNNTHRDSLPAGKIVG